VSSAPDDPADFDSALLLDAEGKRWRVRSPRHAEASTRLETEFLVLRAFAPAIRAELPFLMPTVAGTVRQQNLTTFVYSHLLGATRTVEELTSGPQELAKEIGTALAAIHDLPRTLVSNADLPSYTPNEFRQRRLNELDMAATTGKIPALLLRRWEHAMEDVSLWRFNPCVVHGDMHEDNLLVEDHRVTAVTGWTDLRIGDPADDLAWLVASNEHEFVDAVVKHYRAKRRDAADNHLLRRAALSAEFALAQYQVKGIAAGDDEMIAEAEGMLTTLADDIAEYGGQPISVEPLPPAKPDAPPTSQAPAAPGLVDAPAATDISAAMPAVHVTPIPVDAAPLRVEVTPIPADEMSAGKDADQGGSGPSPDQPASRQDSPGPAKPDTTGETDAAQAEDSAQAGDGAQDSGPGSQSSGADTSTVALTVVDAKTP
jgi:aminoglycoside phosphotransferase (APT) family kinase protein